MTKALEQILSKEFEARDARLRESQPKRDARIDREAKRRVAKYGGTIDEYKQKHTWDAERLNWKAYRHETERAIQDSVGRYLDSHAYVISSEIQGFVDAISPQESSKRDLRYPYSRLKYKTKEAELVNPSRNAYLRDSRDIDYMPLSEAVKLAAGFGKNVEVNTKGNKNDVIFFRDKRKMLQALKRQIKRSPREIKMQIEIG